MRPCVALAGAIGVAASATVAWAGPADAGGVGDCTSTTDTAVAQLSHQRSKPLGLLGIKKAQALVAAPGHLPGAGVNVAVVDSGIRAGSQIPVVASYSVNGPSVKVADYHGTAVAGLVAGRTRPGGLLTGVAPGSGIVDVQFWGWPQGTSGDAAKPGGDHLVAALTWLASHAAALHVRVAVVPDAVQPFPALAVAVHAVQRSGVLVVAPSGNRPTDASPGYLSQYFKTLPGQDGFGDIAPARYAGVLTAGTTAAGSAVAYDPGSIPNHAVDVVVPTARGISAALNGGNCVLTTPATSWAAAEVAGIAALLFDRYDGESPAQVAARITDTASGTTPDGHGPDARSDASLYFGAGVVQPVAALSRPLTSGPGGVFSHLLAEPEHAPPVRPPLETTDVLHHSRHVAIWGGLVGGALVVAASILRPLFGRRPR
jgi:membrane-anchored mycosin MYCP